MDVVQLLEELEVWQKFLDKEYDAFAEVKKGGKIGILPKNKLDEEGMQLLVWEKRDERVMISRQLFDGFQKADLDLLFIADVEALEKVYRKICDDPLTEFKNQIRQGRIIYYYLKPGTELINNGYEELIERFGMPVLGICR